jgi:hypothetical protein
MPGGIRWSGSDGRDPAVTGERDPASVREISPRGVCGAVDYLRPSGPHRLEDDDTAAEGKRVQGVPAKVASNVDDNAARLVTAAPGRLMPRGAQRGLHD